MSAGHEVHEYEFSGPPYLGFASSFDVHGDGSVVVALAGGRTTGSVVVFVTVASGRRYAFIGDLTWQLDGIRGALNGRCAAQARRQRSRASATGLLRVIALADLMQIVPAHDRSAYDGIPTYPPGWQLPPPPPAERSTSESARSDGPACKVRRRRLKLRDWIAPSADAPGPASTRKSPGFCTGRLSGCAARPENKQTSTEFSCAITSC